MARTHRQLRKETGVKGARILVVEARYYEDVADMLRRGTCRARAGAAQTQAHQGSPGPAMKAAAPRGDDRKANRRGAARLAAVQALYQMDIAGTALNDILAEFESHWIGQEVEGSQYLPAEAAFFQSIVRGVLDDQRALDPLIDKALSGGWPLKRIEAILRAVL